MRYDPSTGYIYDDDGNVIARDMMYRFPRPNQILAPELAQELPEVNTDDLMKQPPILNIVDEGGFNPLPDIGIRLPESVIDKLTPEELIELERQIAIDRANIGLPNSIPLPELMITPDEIATLPTGPVQDPDGPMLYAAMSSATNTIAPTQDTLTVTNTPEPTATTSSASYIQQAESLYPNLPPQILQVFAEEWAKTDSPTVAIANVRKMDIYEQYFPGNTRADGTIRYDEVTYTGLKESYIGTLAEYGIPRDTSVNFLSEKFVKLIEGDVAANEFRQRVQAAFTGIQEQIPEVQRFYGEQYGIDLTPEAILLGAIDPELGDNIVAGRITTAQIGGEALRAGFDVTETFATRLRKAGVTQAQARQIFGLAESALPAISGVQARRGLTPEQRIGVEEFTEASIFGSPETERQIARARREQEVAFTPELGAVRRGRKITGILEE